MRHRLLLRTVLVGLCWALGLLVVKAGLWWSDHYPTSALIELWYKVLIGISFLIAVGGSAIAIWLTRRVDRPD